MPNLTGADEGGMAVIDTVNYLPTGLPEIG
jgi:hypothetical protein